MKYTATTEGVRPVGQAFAARRAPRAAWIIPTAALLVVALLPRVWGLADFLTTDEAYHWIERTGAFADALGAGRWAATNQTGHPGVTLMWLGSLGLSLERLAQGVVWAGAPERLAHLAWLRLGPAFAHSLAVGAGYLLLRRLVRPGLALVTALLWATSPFLVAHGRLLHLDALLADLVTLTTLATLVACFAARRWPWLVLAGVLCGLALLTKGPALIMLPVLGLTLFVLGGGDARRTTKHVDRLTGPPGRRGVLERLTARLGWSLSRYLIILGVALATIVALWPALWATPEAAIAGYIGEIVGNGGRPNGDGQFFLGRALGDPGPLFYPLVSLYRLTPVEQIGLAILPIAVWQWARVCSLDPALRRERATLAVLAALAFFWLVVMTLGPKKFDRYILPAWPSLLVLSAAGLGALSEWVMRNARLGTRHARAGMGAVASGMLACQVVVLAWYHPYYLSYYSPLLGGGQAAQRLFLIGWGEGMEQAGAWLSAQPNIGEGQILAPLGPTLQPFVPVPVQGVRAIDRAPANYAVVYLESVQRGDAPETYERIQATLPLHTVTIHGIEYARIHQLPRPFATPLGAEFGGVLGLLGFTATQEGGRLIVTPAWDVRATPQADLTLFLFVFNAGGERVAQIDVRPGGVSYPPTNQWRPGQQVAVPLPITLPAGLPAGDYTLALGLYDPATGVRLPLSTGDAADPIAAGPDAALLGRVALITP